MHAGRRCFLFLTLLSFFSNIFAQEQELLKTTDINKVMQQIFQQHVTKKEMNTVILEHALQIYIDQFDPNRMYLLDQEVKSFVHLSKREADSDITEYKEGNFDEFKRLNTVIQKAILRARGIRQEVEKNDPQLFSDDVEGNGGEKLPKEGRKLEFAKNIEDLKAHIQQDIKRFIQQGKVRYGIAKINRNPLQILSMYDRALQTFENSYLFEDMSGHPLPPAQVENLFTLHVLKALASSLDAHTTFYNNAEAYDIKVRLEKEFNGIGIIIEQISDGSFIIKQVLKDGPAEKSGLILVNDQIVSVDGQALSNMPLSQLMEVLRGKTGTMVHLTLKRKVEENHKLVEKIFDIKLQRASIALNEDRAKAEFETFGNGIIGKITLTSFYHGENGSVSAANDIRDAIKELEKKGNLRGLIIDLRENSGGFLVQAVEVAGLFITDGVIVIAKYSDGTEQYYRDMENHEAFKGPLVILTSKATASAAEIVAQALQDYGVALIVGDEQTYGKGTIQSQTVTDKNASTFFKVTVGKYYTVSGKTPQIQGVKADIVVPGKLSGKPIGEQYLENALSSDTISSEYKDDLKDVDPSLKSWYLRYYYPTIQPKINMWRSMLPKLVKNSQYRIEHNKNYQAFLKQVQGIKEEDADEGEDDTNGAKKNYGVDDLQMAEAVNIVKDMIMLNSHEQAVETSKENYN
jgi:carboxyl-terminal processing protease